MARRMLEGKAVSLFALMALTLSSTIALAASQTGTISQYHLNSDVAGRGVCVTMSPGLPGTGWACLWKDNPLYNEISQALLQAIVNNRQCNVNWATTDSSGHALINMVSCY